MDVILVVLGFLAVTFLGALIRNDAVPWAISLGRFMVKLATRLQTETEREVTGVEAEYERLIAEARSGERTLTSILRFGLGCILGQVRTVIRRPTLKRIAALRRPALKRAKTNERLRVAQRQAEETLAELNAALEDNTRALDEVRRLLDGHSRNAFQGQAD